MKNIVVKSLFILVCLLFVVTAVFAAPPVKVIMHHYTGNGECKEKEVLPEQVADNPEWELGPCPISDPDPTEEVTDTPTDEPEETDEPTETDEPEETIPVVGSDQKVIRVWGIDPAGFYNWKLDNVKVYKDNKSLTETWLAGSGLLTDLQGNSFTAYYTDLPVENFPTSCYNVRVYPSGSDVPVLPVTVQFRGGGIGVYGPHYEFSVVSCDLSTVVEN